MTTAQFIHRSRVPALGIAAAICVAGALALQEYFSRSWGGGPRGFYTMFLAQGIGLTAWAMLIPVAILPMVRRLPVTPAGLLAHGAFGALLTVVHTLVVAALLANYYYGWSPLAIRDIFRDRMYTAYAWNVFTYLLIVAGLLMWTASRRQETTDTAELKPNDGYMRRVLVKSDGRVTLVQAEQITWLEADDNDIVVHAQGSAHRVRGTLTRFGERLDPSRFVRVHRSAIVNVDCVREVQNWFAGDLVAILSDGTRVNVGRTYRDEFMARLEG
jgi:hypothetical protein